MSLGIPFDHIVQDSLRGDSEFREESLKCAIECLDAGEIEVAKKMVRLLVEANIGFEKLGELMCKSPDDIKQMLHPDCDTSADEVFEIIGHIRKHEGIRLEVKVLSEEPAVTQSA